MWFTLGFAWVISKFGAYSSHLIALSEDKFVKCVDRAKLRGYSTKWSDARYILGCAFFCDLLSPCAVLSKVLQHDSLDILGGLSSLLCTSARIAETLLKVLRPMAYLLIYAQERYSGRWKSYLPADDPSKIWCSSASLFITLWTILHCGDHLPEISTGLDCMQFCYARLAKTSRWGRRGLCPSYWSFDFQVQSSTWSNRSSV